LDRSNTRAIPLLDGFRRDIVDELDVAKLFAAAMGNFTVRQASARDAERTSGQVHGAARAPHR
jgi:hypothetical protein